MTKSKKLKAARLRKAPELSGPFGPVPPISDATARQSPEDVGPAPDVSDAAVIAANAKARTQNHANSAKLAGRDGAVPEKGFPKPDLAKAIQYLLFSTASKYRHFLVDWLIAGVTTGLCPDEWKLTSIDFYEDEKAPNGCWIWLYVLDPEGVDVDGNGILRTIDISAFHEETISAVMRMSENGRIWFDADEYTQHKSGCGQLLSFACRKCFKPTREAPNPSYTLQSLRNQFIANALSVSGHDAAATLAGNGMSKDRLVYWAEFASAWDPGDLRDIPAAMEA